MHLISCDWFSDDKALLYSTTDQKYYYIVKSLLNIVWVLMLDYIKDHFMV